MKITVMTTDTAYIFQLNTVYINLKIKGNMHWATTGFRPIFCHDFRGGVQLIFGEQRQNVCTWPLKEKNPQKFDLQKF